MNRMERTLLTLAAAGVGTWLLTRRRQDAYDFQNKVVLITGGSRGLGLVLGRLFQREGSRLAICARDEAELGRARDDLAGHGIPPLVIPCDLTDAAQVNRLVATVREQLGPIDVLVNNAGTIQVGPQESMTLEDYQQALAANFWSAVYTTHAVLPEMRRRHAGRIVNIASIGGKISVPHLLPYSASKFALVGFSEGLTAELAKDGLRVTTVCPGLMRTGSPPNAFFKGQNQAEYAWFSISDSLPLLTISAEHAAEAILQACRRGEAEVILSLPAKLAAAFHGLFPGATVELLSLVNRLLPASGGIGTGTARGSESTSSGSPSTLTKLTEEAARRNNQLQPAS